MIFKSQIQDKKNIFKIDLDKGDSPKKISGITKKILVNSEEKREDEPSGFYEDLFSINDVYADGVFNLQSIDTSWQIVESSYKARGDENHITLGVFKFSNHKEILEAMKVLNSYKLTNKKFIKLVKKNPNTLLKLCYPKDGKFTEKNLEMLSKYKTATYFLLDDIKVELINK